jgi:type II secretory pathway component GspD/PulD (secretin)
MTLAIALLAALPVQDLDVERWLASTRVSVDFQEVDFDDTIEFLRETSGLNIVVDRRLRGGPPVTLRLAGVTLKSLLGVILRPRDAAYAVSEGIVRIVPVDEIRGRVTLRIYDVSELTFPLRDMPGGEIMITEEGLRSFPADDAGMSRAASEDLLLEILQAFTGRAAWDDNPHASIVAQNGLLIVRQTPEVHRRIEGLVRLLRRF